MWYDIRLYWGRAVQQGPQGRMWPTAYIYVALQGITNKIIFHMYMN